MDKVGGQNLDPEAENNSAYNELYANRADSAHDGTILANSKPATRGQIVAPVLFKAHDIDQTPAKKQREKPKVVKMKKKQKAASGGTQTSLMVHNMASQYIKGKLKVVVNPVRNEGTNIQSSEFQSNSFC